MGVMDRPRRLEIHVCIGNAWGYLGVNVRHDLNIISMKIIQLAVSGQNSMIFIFLYM